MALSPMVDMELDDEDQLDAVQPILMPDRPRYPYGLRLCLTEKELPKLKLDPSDIQVGDFVDLRMFATVTSVSITDGGGGQCCRVELQGEKLQIENETTESDED